MVNRRDISVNILLTENKNPDQILSDRGVYSVTNSVAFLLDTVFVFVSLVQLCMLTT